MNSVVIVKRESHSASHFRGPCLLCRQGVQPDGACRVVILHSSLATVDQLILVLVSAALLCPSSGRRNMPDTGTSLFLSLELFLLFRLIRLTGPAQRPNQAGGPAYFVRAHCRLRYVRSLFVAFCWHWI